jgi:hypothetical protein
MTCRRISIARIASSLGAAAACAAPIRAAIVRRTYVAGMDSTWNVNEHWSPWGVPNNSGVVEYGAVIDDGHIVSLDLSATVTALSLSNGSQLWISNDRTLSLWGATPDAGGSQANNQGTLRIAAEGTNTRIHINQGPVEFSGSEGGQMVMDAGTGAGFSEIFGTGGSSTRLINNAGHTFRGAGSFQNPLSLTNHGLIAADVAAKALEIRVPTVAVGGDCTNDGILRAENGATLRLRRTATTLIARYINTDGVIEALDGSTVELDGQTIIEGGELRTPAREGESGIGTGVIRCVAGGGVLKNIANSGTLRLAHNATVSIVGQIVNSGTIWFDSIAPGGGGLVLTSEGDVTLSGGGVIELGDNLNNVIASGATSRRQLRPGPSAGRPHGQLPSERRGSGRVLPAMPGRLRAAGRRRGARLRPPGAAGPVERTGRLRHRPGR